MPRILGVDIPGKKRIEYSLCYIYGIGLTTSQKILEITKISPDTRVKDLKEDEINQFEKDDLEKLRKELETFNKNRNEMLSTYGSEHKIVKQLIDLALLANNMLRGEDMSQFVKRSVDLL